MAITPQQERELLNALQDYVDTSKRADKYIKDLNEYRDLSGKIAIEISQIRHMSVSQARSYIDGKTGKFKPGIGMTICPSDKIQGLFNQLESVITDINRCSWTTKEAALRDVADKKNKVESMAAKLKSQSDYTTVISRVKSQVR